MKEIHEIIEDIAHKQNGTDKELLTLIGLEPEDKRQLMYGKAEEVRRLHYGNEVYIRGLIEISNYCRNDCIYCGIRRSNKNLKRYRLTEEEILSCCESGRHLGFRTFVLQGGEDGFYTGEFIEAVVRKIKTKYTDCAVTLSLGEQEEETYRRWREAGADRYLLRHETAVKEHYQKLHPPGMSLSHRKRCLLQLKALGYQVGSGFMVGSPGQKIEYLLADIRFLQKLEPDMIGIGPFLPHADTPFHGESKGSLVRCLNMIALLRLLFPKALLPSTTALGTLCENGRELGLCCGANVVMPNLSPVKLRKLYSLYNNKLAVREESAEGLAELREKVKAIGYEIITGRGDAKTLSL